MLEQILSGMFMVLSPENLIWAAAGVTFGMILGSIPGLTDNMGIVLFLPFTFYLGPVAGIAMLMGLTKGGNFGGSIPAILFNIPGTPQAMVTTLDGYPLTQQGKGGKALKQALFSSVVADAGSDLILIFLAAPVAMVALKIGPPEYTSIIFFSLIVISVAASEFPVRGVIAVILGLLLGTVGMDPEFGSTRLIFNTIDLADGFHIMPMVIGMLAFSEVLLQFEKELLKRWHKKMSEKKPGKEGPPEPSIADHHLSWAEFKKTLPTIFRSTGIGASIGIIPGIGTTVGSYLSYIMAKQRSRHPEKFGKGSLEGVAAAEAGNNAVNGPNLIPLVTLGIPGNLAAALILGGFMIKGLIPGPTFMQTNGDMLYALFIILLLSNIFTLLIGSFYIKHVKNVTAIPKPYLFTGIIVFSVIGSYVNYASVFDVFVMLGFAILGYVLTKFKINLPTVIVAFFLGPMLETKLRQALKISGNDATVFFTEPISLGFLVLTAVAVFFLVRRRNIPKG
ncbi:MAG: tripartite tricarboxylate transporter permease [Desulfohalobiaceae bacterium]|nr:tripartite tricarboxylate transporter permease [Desulfohalobiaceae bacterium]